ncbi:MAG: hypothetical protein ACKO5K_03245 [Armatimonadota bacterium]
MNSRFSRLNSVVLLMPISIATVGLAAWRVRTAIAQRDQTAPLGHVDATAHGPGVRMAGEMHYEARLDASGNLVIHRYGERIGQLAPLPDKDAADIEVEAFVAGEPATAVELRPKPYRTDPDGTSSRFVAHVPAALARRTPCLVVVTPENGTSVRLFWDGQDLAGISEDDRMPAPMGDREAAKVFLKSGGLYTDADIVANGNTTAARRYGSAMTRHNAHPKPGDQICPISETKANPKFAWTVGGKSYAFCCPPCIEEFVRKAKETPGDIQPPAAFVKR